MESAHAAFFDYDYDYEHEVGGRYRQLDLEFGIPHSRPRHPPWLGRTRCLSVQRRWRCLIVGAVLPGCAAARRPFALELHAFGMRCRCGVLAGVVSNGRWGCTELRCECHTILVAVTLPLEATFY